MQLSAGGVSLLGWLWTTWTFSRKDSTHDVKLLTTMGPPKPSFLGFFCYKPYFGGLNLKTSIVHGFFIVQG